MPYPSLPGARRIQYEIDGTVAGFNEAAGYGAGMTTVFSGANLINLNGETPTISAAVAGVGHSNTGYFVFLFPELVDVSYFILRWVTRSLTLTDIAGSANTTTGADGTWTTIGTSGTTDSGGTGDWWRATTPATLTSNNTSLVGLRFSAQAQAGFGGDTSFLASVYLWGHKHSGQTPDDIIFLESDATTEWPHDDDWGDLNAASAAVTHTYYVKNTSATKTANTITVKSSGSDSGQWTVSLDNSSFASSKSIGSLAAGATQVVYFKFTPPAATSGNFRPFAGYLEADVTSWT